MTQIIGSNWITTKNRYGYCGSVIVVLYDYYNIFQFNSIFYWRKHLTYPLPYNKQKHGIQTFKYVTLYTVIYIDCYSKKANFMLRKV